MLNWFCVLQAGANTPAVPAPVDNQQRYLCSQLFAFQFTIMLLLLVSKATALCVPTTTADRDKTSMQGWSDYVKDKYDRKVRSGFHHYAMFKTGVAFKYALRYCHRHSEQLTADAGATDLLDTHNPNKRRH